MYLSLKMFLTVIPNMLRLCTIHVVIFIPDYIYRFIYRFNFVEFHKIANLRKTLEYTIYIRRKVIVVLMKTVHVYKLICHLRAVKQQTTLVTMAVVGTLFEGRHLTRLMWNIDTGYRLPINNVKQINTCLSSIQIGQN